MLTGVEAGARLEDGTFAEGTVHGLVDRRLEKLAQTMQAFGRPMGEEETS